MFADTLFDLERGHLLRLGVWAAASIVAGVLLLGFLLKQKSRAPFVLHFGIQMLAWGTIELAIVTWGFSGLARRDYAASLQLQQFLWLNVGLAVGYVGVGITLALAGWITARRLGPVGAGIAVVLHGLALFVLDVRLLTLMGAPQ